MFTGLIEEVGAVVRLARVPEGAHLHVRAHAVLGGTRLGDSIAVNGACLTVVQVGEGSFAVDCMAETLAHTTLGTLRPGDPVNLERAMALGDRLGGHLVLGHVDAVGEVAAVQTRGIAWELRVKLPAELRGYVAPKGSVAVDGISLTVTDVSEADFGLGIIPHTLASTTLKGAAPGRRVNLEADVLARYVRQALSGLLAAGEDAGRKAGGEGGLTRESLRRLGF
ncbi:MAG: riboflavin synthase [Gaiellales bacterium]|nr:riboflavin synthase [Gaiellales bacterium]